MVEEEGFQVDETGDVGDGPGEGVVLQAEDPELVESTQRARRENAAEVQTLDDQSNHSALKARDSHPFAVTEAAIVREREVPF